MTVLSVFAREVLSAESLHFCQLLKTFKSVVGLNTPTNSGKQKYFLIIGDYFCQLQDSYKSEDTVQYGVTLGFKNNKMCRISQWLRPKTGSLRVAFAVRSGSGDDPWTQNMIGLVSIEYNL